MISVKGVANMVTKKLFKTLVASLIVVCCSMNFMSTSEAASNSQLKTKQVYFKDQAVNTSVIYQNDYQLVPASFFRQMGATVEWNASDSSVLVTNGNNKVKLYIGSLTAEYLSASVSDWATEGNLSTRNRLVNGTSYIPLAYTANKLGIQVEYDTQLKAARLLTDILFKSSSANTVSNQIIDEPSKEVSASSKLSNDDIYWLYRLAEAEAGGESYEGRVAVAATVLNRVETDGFPNTVVDTIFEVVNINGKAYYQFEPVLNKYIYKVTPSAETIQAVQDAINGVDPTGGAVVFYNPAKTSNKWILSREVVKKIGNHVFAL